MRAVLYDRYGPPEVLRLHEIERPFPRENELLVRVYAGAVNFGDLTARKFDTISSREFHMPMPLWLPARLSFGLRKPRNPILGSELAGEIVEVGPAVREFKPGDQIFAYTGMKMRANAEYICIPENALVGLKPSNMSYAEAACLPYGGLMALSLLRKVTIAQGDRVLINGASGGIGAMALQLTKHFGAEVTGVCSTPRVDYVKSLGADYVIDYTREDFTENGKTYDLIFDILGKSTFARCKGSLNADGVYLLASFKMGKVLQMLATSIIRRLPGRKNSKRVICAIAGEDRNDMTLLKDLAESGQIKTLIDRTFPLEQTAEAHTYLEKGRKKGSVVLSME